MTVDEKATSRTRARYQRIAPLYDAVETIAEIRYSDWRPRLWSLVEGPKVLEVGVGTGKNMPHYPKGVEVTAIDLTPGMLERAKRRAGELDVDVTLQLGDIQDLSFPDNTFDDVVATFVFCSVPDPMLGLSEVARVLKPGGQLLLLEHVRAASRFLGGLMDVVNPMAVRMMGANINRRTVENVGQSPLSVTQVEDLDTAGIFKLITARKNGTGP